MFNAEGVDVSLFDLIAAYQRHPQTSRQLCGKSALPGSLPTRDDNAHWFYVHASVCLTTA
jgi:hypothetical protein